jgi:hypothetical protein
MDIILMSFADPDKNDDYSKSKTAGRSGQSGADSKLL